MDFTALTQQLIRAYLGDDAQSTRQVMEMVAEDIIVIGTGRQEIFRSRKEYMAALERELVERHGMHFEVLSLECAVHPITPEAVLVTGPLIIYGSGAEAEGEPMGVYMETRYSIVYRKEADGWKVAHLHHSVPDIAQSDQETYPKTLLRQVEEARRLAQRDPLTDLLNLRAFQEQYRRMAPEDAWLYIIDIDHFKQTNDAFGHLVGNQVLRELAAMMVSSVRATDVVCRMGGRRIPHPLHGNAGAGGGRGPGPAAAGGCRQNAPGHRASGKPVHRHQPHHPGHWPEGGRKEGRPGPVPVQGSRAKPVYHRPVGALLQNKSFKIHP